MPPNVCMRVCWAGGGQVGLGAMGPAHLALLVSIRQQLQTVGGDGEELGVAFLKQGNHSL